MTFQVLENIHNSPEQVTSAFNLLRWTCPSLKTRVKQHWGFQKACEDGYWLESSHLANVLYASCLFSQITVVVWKEGAR